MHTKSSILKTFNQVAKPNNEAYLKQFGIQGVQSIGVRMPDIRAIAKSIGTNHTLALELWTTNIHEMKILASLLVDENIFTEQLLDEWVNEFNSWDLCDQCCCNLFYKLPFIEKKIIEYANHEHEFQKRFSFAMIAVLAVHWKKSDDIVFEKYFSLLISASNDERNFVKKAVNWAIRQIGKRNEPLNEKCIELCEKLLESEYKSAHWIAKDALKELTSSYIQYRVRKK